MSILDIHKKLQNKEISSTELTQVAIDKVKKYNSEINFLNTLTDKEALEKALQVDEKMKNPFTPQNAGSFPKEAVSTESLLAGIPMTIKDVIVTKGIRTTASSKMLNTYIPQYDSTTHARLDKAGAIMIGKNNSDPFAFGASGENSGFGPTRNPVCINRITGGSSSGSAAAVKLEVGEYSIGTDTGGSIRQPAALTGLSGLKVSYGRNSRYGLIAMGSSWDTPGVLAKNTEDAWIVQKYIEGHDPKDGTSSHEPFLGQGIDTSSSEFVEKVKSELDKLKSSSIAGMKIGIPQEYFADGVDEDIKKVVLDAIKEFEIMGCELVDIQMPYTKYAVPVYYVVVPTEIASNMGRFDGIRYGGLSKEIDQNNPIDAKEALNNAQDLESFYLENRALLEPEVKRRIMIGTYTSAKGYADRYYSKAMQVRTLIKQDFDKAFEKVDVIMAPTSPVVAWGIGTKSDDPVFNYLADIFTIPVNAAGIPGLSINVGYKTTVDPAGFGKNYLGEVCMKLPIGMQIIGSRFEEDKICKFGMEWEKRNEE
ncbi:Asp-tRNA(Asn)/Glu-tRNA(Gln) amidotransferase subunit GatA [bacterium]|nr:MAG: Asp-tRNA(Asn)/Glu-tRNA(Gln) amidotransferase subunit GatA [bacterium]